MEKQNPNSHEQSWSELPLDLLILVFERLAFTDFQRGKSVCSAWYTASRHSVHKKNKTPWLIIFPVKHDEDYFTLLNPEEKHKPYKTKGFSLEFATSVCRAIYGNWLLMQDPELNLYIVNLFTKERFSLPFSNYEDEFIRIRRTPVFWIDEKTKDYVVVLGLASRCVHYSKKGDTSWKLIPKTGSCRDMLYKDHKLYFLSDYHDFKIFDFSGEVPQETFECRVYVDPDMLTTTKLVVTVTGDVLKVKKFTKVHFNDERPPFRIYKVYSSQLLEECKKVDSLGDEAILFYQGITLLASDIEGFNINSIYLDGRSSSDANVFFNLETQKMERLCNFDFLSYVQLAKARWFLPSFMHT